MESHLQFTCDFCYSPDQRLSDMEQLRHIRMEHLGQYKPYKCIQCDQSYVVEPMFRKHTIEEHDSNSITPDSSRSSQFLNVLGDMMMQCSFYNAIGHKQTATKLVNTVRKRTTIETNDKLTVGNSASIKLHSQTGESKRKLECEFCDLSFTHLGKLKLHQDATHNRISSGAHKCSHCEKRYHFPSILGQHLEHNHKMPSTPKPESPKSTNFQCQNSQLRTTKKQSPKSKHTYSCVECKSPFSGTVDYHLATFHIKKAVVACSECDYKNFWNMGNARKHIDAVHKGCARVVDQRTLIAGEIKRLTKEIIKCTVQNRVVDRVAFMKKSATGRRVKWAQCLECKSGMGVGSVREHLATKHIRKQCVKCEGCLFYSHWRAKPVQLHLKNHHRGENIGFVNKRHEIEDEIRKLTKRYIRFRQKI